MSRAVYYSDDRRDQARDAFLDRVRKALGKPPGGGPVPEGLFDAPPPDLAARLDAIQNRTPEQRRALLDELTARGAAVDLQVTPVADAAAAARAIRRIVTDTQPEWGTEKRVVAWDHPLVASLDLETVLEADGVPVTVAAPDQGADPDTERSRLRKAIEASYIGITGADFVAAHTATIVARTRPGQARSVSLVPSVHVAVVTLDQIVADLDELYTRLLWDPATAAEGLTHCMTFISAPSKTGDIELVMVHGAHGPRRVRLVVIME